MGIHGSNDKNSLLVPHISWFPEARDKAFSYQGASFSSLQRECPRNAHLQRASAKTTEDMSREILCDQRISKYGLWTPGISETPSKGLRDQKQFL